jgi:hypothetical protein
MHVHVLSLYLQEEFNLKVFGDNKRCTIFVDRVRTCSGGCTMRDKGGLKQW